jgi:hypothetical protein
MMKSKKLIYSGTREYQSYWVFLKIYESDTGALEYEETFGGMWLGPLGDRR